MGHTLTKGTWVFNRGVEGLKEELSTKLNDPFELRQQLPAEIDLDALRSQPHTTVVTEQRGEETWIYVYGIASAPAGSVAQSPRDKPELGASTKGEDGQTHMDLISPSGPRTEIHGRYGEPLITLGTTGGRCTPGQWVGNSMV